MVDNASVDGSTVMVREKFPSLRLIVNEPIAFFNSPIIRLLPRVRTLCIDPELRCGGQAGTLAALTRYLDAHADIGAATTRLFFPDGRLQHNCARFSTYASMLMDYTFLGVVQRSRHRRCAGICGTRIGTGRRNAR